VQSQVLQNVAVRIDLAFQAFFRRVKAGEPDPGYPRFRGRGRYDSLTFPRCRSGVGWRASGCA
jgi:putative transposase